MVEESLEQSHVLMLNLSPKALGSNWIAVERTAASIATPPTKTAASFRSCRRIAPTGHAAALQVRELP
jgi:hypothetical protein